MKKILLLLLIASLVATPLIFVYLKPPAGGKVSALGMPIHFDGQKVEESSSFYIPSHETEHMLEFGGHQVRVDIYHNEVSSSPILILLYGSTGLTDESRSSLYDDHIEYAVNHGWIVAMPHYLDLPKSQWRRTVRATIEATRHLENANPNKVAAAGFSLGGRLLSAMALEKTHPFDALALHAGFVSERESKEDVRHFPPTLLVSGDEDDRFHTLQAMEHWLDDWNIPNESVINEGYGHSAPFEIHHQNWEATIRFFEEHVVVDYGEEETPVEMKLADPQKSKILQLKNGKVIEGEITQETESSLLVLKPDGQFQMIYKDDVKNL